MKENTKLSIYDQSADLSLKNDKKSSLEIISSESDDLVLADKGISRSKALGYFKSMMSLSKDNLSLTSKEKLYFFENLSILINSGIPILESLKILLDQAKTNKMKFFINFIFTNIKQGNSLSKIMSGFKFIKESELGLIQAGEQTGQLASSLGQIAKSIQVLNNQSLVNCYFFL